MKRKRHDIPPPPPLDATVLNAREVCGLLRIRERYLYELRTKDMTFPYLIGANETLRWTRSAVEAWLQGLAQGWAKRGSRGVAC